MKVTENIYAFLWQDPRVNNANTYLVRGAENILIDPGHYHLFGYVRDHLSRLSLTTEDIDLVVVTHAHPDHMEGIEAFSGSSTLIALNPVELEFIESVAPHYGSSMGISGFEPQVLLKEGDLEVGDMSFRVIHTPGHSPGSISIYWPGKKALFCGDVVFQQGLGRTDLPGGNGGQLKESIRRLGQLDVEYLFPGHGDIVAGRESVRRNFTDVETMWFGYI
jgi:glyoxylase-like metal-dependent hydrolase (beta-lactamase superfamily II)